MCVGVTVHIIPGRTAEGEDDSSDGNHGDEFHLNIKTRFQLLL
jgi:hypothetical protein